MYNNPQVKSKVIGKIKIAITPIATIIITNPNDSILNIEIKLLIELFKKKIFIIIIKNENKKAIAYVFIAKRVGFLKLLLSKLLKKFRGLDITFFQSLKYPII
jgi:hypothetical protein